MPWFISLLIGIALNIIGYLLMPKPKQPKPPSVSDVDDPTADAGRPLPLLWGSLTTTGPNNMGFWDKEIATRKVKVGKK